ncbi:hypothetical protein GHT06_022121 [Daphnia sinensis]|uniref:Uncharacterized protein n=1 Tax=Daphnia sinensis TaxID=1820382 RepID=A0AAD5KWI9_9CRUS|nr:hypothetical protein GHT06_022121 [Daphnia sinensis]
MEGKRRIAPEAHFRSGMPGNVARASALFFSPDVTQRSKNPISIAATAFSERAEKLTCFFQPSHISPSDGLAMPIIARLIEFNLKATLFSPHC